MSQWPSTKANIVLRALLRRGWRVLSQKGSHIKLQHAEYGNYMFGFHENEEIGHKMLPGIAKRTGLLLKTFDIGTAWLLLPKRCCHESQSGADAVVRRL